MSSGLEDMQVTSLGESYSGLQDECPDRVMDPMQQKSIAGIKKYAIWKQDHIDEQSEVVERNEQRVACTSAHRGILALSHAET